MYDAKYMYRINNLKSKVPVTHFGELNFNVLAREIFKVNSKRNIDDRETAMATHMYCF